MCSYVDNCNTCYDGGYSDIKSCTNFSECKIANRNYFSAAGNRIETITNHEFDELLMKNFNEINLESNKISLIDDDICGNNNKDITLNLNNNNLTKIPQNMATCVKTLRLDNNKLEIPINTPILISDALQVLHVINCSLTNVYKETFAKLSNLHTLNITHNNIQEENLRNILCYKINLTIFVNKEKINCEYEDIIIRTANHLTEKIVHNDNFILYAFLFLAIVIFCEFCIFLKFLYIVIAETRRQK